MKKTIVIMLVFLTIIAFGVWMVGRQAGINRLHSARLTLQTAYLHWTKIGMPLDSRVNLALEGIYGTVPAPEISRIAIGSNNYCTLFSLPSELAGGQGKLYITTNRLIIVVSPKGTAKLITD